MLRLVKQDGHLGRAFYVGIAYVAEELLHRLEHFGLVAALVDHLANAVVAFQLRLVGEAAVASVTPEVLLVLEQFVLRVRTGRLEAFAADFAHVTRALHVDEYVVRDGRPGEEAFFAVVTNEVLTAGVAGYVHVVVLDVYGDVTALFTGYRLLAVMLRDVEQKIRFREYLLIAPLRGSNEQE